MRPTRYPSRARALLCEGFHPSFLAILLSREQVCDLILYCAERGSASFWPSGWHLPARCLLPGVWAVAFGGSAFAAGRLPYPRTFAVRRGADGLMSSAVAFSNLQRLLCGGGRSFFGGERFSWKMLLTANFSLVKLITVNLEEAKLPVKNFYTSSSAMFSSGSYWDVATALSFYSPEVAPTRNLLLLNKSVNEKEPAVWRVLSV